MKEETKRKISSALKGRTTWNKGKKHTEEHKRRAVEGRINYKHSAETKRKISENNKGKHYLTEEHIQKMRKPKTEEHKRKLSEAHKGHTPWNKGKSWSEETKDKMRASKLEKPTKYWLGKNRLDMLGKNNSSWKGGITPINQKIRNSKEYKLWRTAVLERDGYTCIWCGARGSIERYLHVDHIKPFSLFPELRFAIDNGRTLCKDCHEKTDTYAGRYLNGRK